MTEPEVNIHVLDAAYKPFPTFKQWAASTNVDPTRWDRYNSLLKSRVEQLSPEIIQRARNIATRAAALDTGAIENLYEVDRGFTYTVAFETAAWEAALAQKGEHVRSLFEAQLHAYDYVLDLATKAEQLSEAAIRALHEEVCRAQSTYRVITAVGPQEQALPKGQYKVLPNHVRTRKGTDHSYAPVDVTPAEMARLVAEMRSGDFLAAHPVQQASYSHYALVVIHPFADGNGRVARALASAFTYRTISMPIVILSENKNAYLDALESADSGNYQSFVNFMLARSLDTVRLVDESVRASLSPAAEQSVEQINRLYVTKGGYSHDEVDGAGKSLVSTVAAALKQVVALKTSSARIHSGINLVGGQVSNPQKGYRNPMSANKGTAVSVALSTPQPAQANVSRTYFLLVPKDAAGDDDIQLVTTGSPQPDTFLARMDELQPTVSGALQMRVDMFAQRVVAELLAQLKSEAEKLVGR
jgi:Fic family protein